MDTNLTPPAPPAPLSPPGAPARPAPTPKAADKRGWWWGTGRRKAAVARVRLKVAPGGGAVTIHRADKKTLTIDQYFSEERDRSDALLPLKVTGTEGKFEIHVRPHGGGYMGQAQAIMLGIARALRNYDPTFDGALRDNGLLTRDSRAVERKKYGQAGARRRFQFSKR